MAVKRLARLQSIQQRKATARQWQQCGYGGVMSQSLANMLYDCFGNDNAAAANYFGVSTETVRRWLRTGNWPSMAARLLMVRHRGYMPTVGIWARYKILDCIGPDGKRGLHLVTPEGWTITAGALHSWFYAINDYNRLKAAEARRAGQPFTLLTFPGSRSA